MAWEWICDASTVERMRSRRCSGGDLANTVALRAVVTWYLPVQPMIAVGDRTDVGDGS